jgi:hypothetical protein
MSARTKVLEVDQMECPRQRTPVSAARLLSSALLRCGHRSPQVVGATGRQRPPTNEMT